MGVKQFKSLEEQIEILRYKGLIINDEKMAQEVLFRENYFFLNGYRHLFMKSNKDRSFLAGTTFEELYSLFLFDRNFRYILFKNLLVVENNLKSMISYQLSKKYGIKEKDYLNPKNFVKDSMKTKQVNDLLRKMKRQIRANGAQHSATLHYITNYGYIPLWVLVKVLSFGIVTELFAILKPEDQADLAKVYNVRVEELLKYLPILSNYRNLCAHEDIVYENRTQVLIDDCAYHKLLNIDKMDGEYIYGKNDLFALMIILKRMLSNYEFSNMIEEIKKCIMNLDYNLHTISIDKVLDRMGFPKNWENIKNIEMERLS